MEPIVVNVLMVESGFPRKAGIVDGYKSSVSIKGMFVLEAKERPAAALFLKLSKSRIESGRIIWFYVTPRN